MSLGAITAAAMLGALLGSFAAWRFVFFHRNPKRVILPGDFLLSPADGRILYCEPVDVETSTDPYHARVRDTLGLRGAYDVTAIYLSIFDVHFVRASCAGRVSLRPLAPLGRENLSMGMSMFYAALKRPLPMGRRTYAQKNELLGMTIASEEEQLHVHLVLMADWWMDQITVFVREGEHIARGQLLAKIQMGSQVDVWAPRGEYQLDCAVGRRVLAGRCALGARHLTNLSQTGDDARSPRWPQPRDAGSYAPR